MPEGPELDAAREAADLATRQHRALHDARTALAEICALKPADPEAFRDEVLELLERWR